MNMFVLDEIPAVAANYHCNKHVVKMILEAGQMGCAAHWMSWLDHFGKSRSDFKLMRDVKEYLRVNVPQDKQPPWGLTHVNHPCTVWTRESLANYEWHMELMGCLLNEYTLRYEKIHKSTTVHNWLLLNMPVNFPVQGKTPFHICMKEEYKVDDDPVKSYRNYYIQDKIRFAKWEPRAKTPGWFPKKV
jgi:hypothetical protein